MYGAVVTKVKVGGKISYHLERRIQPLEIICIISGGGDSKEREIDEILAAVGIGRCGSTSCSFPMAIRLPVNVRSRAASQSPAPHDEAVKFRVRVWLALVELRRAHQRRRQRAARVRQRGSLRHRRHGHDVGDGDAHHGSNHDGHRNPSPVVHVADSRAQRSRGTR